MKWFKQKFSVCKTCGVHYEPVSGYESRWGDLCPIHRQPVMERDSRRGAVIEWATYNWEKLEPMYRKETLAQVEERNAALRSTQEMLRARAGQQAAGPHQTFGLGTSQQHANKP